jgi:hypothetical protein
MDGWADYEGEVTRHGDLFSKDNASPEDEAIPAIGSSFFINSLHSIKYKSIKI